jgi:hypothetical protein
MIFSSFMVGVDDAYSTGLLCRLQKFLQPLLPQRKWFGLAGGSMMSRDDWIDYRATVQAAPA